MAKLTHRQNTELFDLILGYGSAQFHLGTALMDPAYYALDLEGRRATRKAEQAKADAAWAKVADWLTAHSKAPTLAELHEDIARHKAEAQKLAEGGES